MRRLSLILLSCLVVVPAALAGTTATGDGVLELSAVNGTVLLNGKGVVWGQMDQGKLVVNDVDPTVGDIPVSGAEHKVLGPCDTCITYTGRDIHFRVTGGKYKLWFQGAGIDLTAVGVGSASLTGDVRIDNAGDYALDGGKWLPVLVPWVKHVVPFGVPPVPAGP